MIYLWNYLNNWLCARMCVYLPLEGIKELEKEKLSLQSDSESYSDQVTELISGLMQHCQTLFQLPLAVELTSLQLYV